MCKESPTANTTPDATNKKGTDSNNKESNNLWIKIILFVLFGAILVVCAICAIKCVFDYSNYNNIVIIVAMCCLCALGICGMICGMICATIALVKFFQSRKRSEPSDETIRIMCSAYEKMFRDERDKKD